MNAVLNALLVVVLLAGAASVFVVLYAVVVFIASARGEDTRSIVADDPDSELRARWGQRRK
jgi:hypothetical protein